MKTTETIVGIGFPDVAFLDSRYLSAALVYFDRLVIPNCPEPMPAPAIARLESVFRSLPFARGSDVTSGFRKFREIAEVIATLQELERVGLVIRSRSPGVVQTESIELTNLVIRDLGRLDAVHVAAGRAKHWVSIGASPSVSAYESPTDELIGDTILYCWESIKRILEAAIESYHLVVHTGDDWRAVQQVLAQLSDKHIPITSPANLEVMRLAVPSLVARHPSDILAIRDELRDFLDPFRAEIGKISASLDPGMTPRELADAAGRVVDSTIRPQIVELRRYLASPNRALLKHLVADTKTIAVGTMTLAASYRMGAPLETSAILTGLATIMSALVTAGHERYQTKWSNPMTFAILSEDRASV